MAPPPADNTTSAAADDEALHYLPPGWTEEEYATATDEDFEHLPDDVIERNMQRMAAEARLHLRGALDRLHASDAATGRRERRSEVPDGELPIVRQVEAARFERFGFFVFRTHFGDDDRWERFVDRFYAILDEAEDRLGPETGWARVKDKEVVQIVDDEEAMEGKGSRAVALAFSIFKEEGQVEPGLDTKMCLMVDAECIASVLDDRPDKDTVPPFVKAVDVTDEPPAEVHVDPEYEGYFKVAISSVILELYPALTTFSYPCELAAFAKPIWESPL